jgi:23S rRNA-/tRNA-specific pseudouridylate synthase
MEVRRLRNIGDQSVIRVSMQSGDVRQLRQRLRDWGHPVVGDPDYGFDSANALTARSEWLDRLALHCVRVVRGDQVFDAPVPPELLPILKLPGHRLLP